MLNITDIEAFREEQQEFDFMQEEVPYPKHTVFGDDVFYNLGDYQEFVEDMIITRGDDRLAENTLGLVGEAGEVAEKVKKIFRDKAMPYSVADIEKELGDVMFYLTALANYFDLDLTSVIEANVEKLHSRKTRGVIQGSGDNR